MKLLKIKSFLVFRMLETEICLSKFDYGKTRFDTKTLTEGLDLKFECFY